MSEKILVVDDEETLRLTLKARLRSDGFEAEVAEDGEDALEKLKQDSFAVVLLDIKMPRMDGIEALEHIARQYPDTDVLMLTGFADFTTAIDCLKKGAKDFLIKPVDSTELISRLRSILRARTSDRALRDLQMHYIAIFLHDVLGPAKAISSTISQIREGKYGSISKEQGVLLKHAGELADKLTKRATDMIDLTRFETGAVKLERSAVDVGSGVEGIYQRYDVLSQAKGITLQKSVDSNLPVVNCDFEKLTHVLNAILDNALQFTPKGGKITISVSKASATGTVVDKDSILFSIQDSGKGIPQALLPMIFEKYKAQLVTKSIEPTKAISNLTIAKYIVDAHGGTISAKSQVDSGSTFSFTVPMK